MPESIEVRWHGRGGQGAKTGAILLAEAASAAGKFVQAFPEYGPERMGAPMRAFNRISDEPITIHSGVKQPDVVVVLDETLLGKVPVTEGLTDGGKVIVNTPEPPEVLRDRLGLRSGQVFTVDASGIAEETFGRNIPNTPMVAALVRVTGVVDYEKFLEIMREQLESKFKGRSSIIEGNLRAIERGYREVRGE